MMTITVKLVTLVADYVQTNRTGTGNSGKQIDRIVTSDDVSAPGTDVSFLAEVSDERKPHNFSIWAALVDQSLEMIPLNTLWKDGCLQYWALAVNSPITDNEREDILQAIDKFATN